MGPFAEDGCGQMKSYRDGMAVQSEKQKHDNQIIINPPDARSVCDMKNQDSRFVEDIVRRFYSKRFPGKVVENFHLWLLSSKDYTAKDEAMSRIWLEAPHSVTPSAYHSLAAVKARLGMTPVLKKSMRLNLIVMRAAAVMLPVMLLVGAYFINGRTSKAEWTSLEITYGQTGYHMLPDGTEVWLNSGSSLEYPEKFKGRKREVRLCGEGFFNVAADKRKPFIINTAHLSTKVVGTKFNISSYANQKNECVTVLSGRVEVTTKDNATHSLVPDRRLTYRIKDGHTDIEEVDAASVIRWRENGLVFENSTFEDILHALQRKYDFNVVIDPVNFTEMLYRMKFVNNEPLGYILDVVHSVVGLPYTFEDGILEIGGGPGEEQELTMTKRLQQTGQPGQ